MRRAYIVIPDHLSPGKVREIFLNSAEGAIQNAMASVVDLETIEGMCIEKLAECAADVA